MDQRVLQYLADDIVALVDVAQAVRLIQHDQIPGNGLDVLRLGLSKLVGANHRATGKHKGFMKPCLRSAL